MSHSDFWQRYFYKIYQLDQEDKRRAELMKRAEITTDSDLAWDDGQCFHMCPLSIHIETYIFINLIVVYSKLLAVCI